MAPGTPRPVEDVLRELAEVQDELLAAPSDDFARRADLLARQDALRAEAAEARTAVPDNLSAEQLEQRVEYLEAEIVRHLESRPAASAGAQTGMGGGIDPYFLQEMNQKAAVAFGLEEKQTELQRLRARLGELRGD
jgi:hypothetical protein